MDTFIYNQEYKRKLKEDSHPYGEVSLLESIAEPGMTALDVGANKGLTTVAISAKVGSLGRVYAFEPVPEYYRTLQVNLDRNDIDNVKVYRIALGNRPGTVDYYKDGGGSGIVRQNGARELTAEVKTLDAFAEEQRLEQIDLISMDCEGSELLVLEGGEKTLQSGPLRLLCEIHQERLKTLGQSVEQIVAWLVRRGCYVSPIIIDDIGQNVDYEHCTHIFASRDAGSPGPDDAVKRLKTQLAGLQAKPKIRRVISDLLLVIGNKECLKGFQKITVSLEMTGHFKASLSYTLS